jgi:hypothetical protein
LKLSTGWSLVRLAGNVVEEALADLGVTGSVGGQCGDSAEDDNGEEEEIGGEEEGPEVGQDGEETRYEDKQRGS